MKTLILIFTLLWTKHLFGDEWNITPDYKEEEGIIIIPEETHPIWIRIEREKDNVSIFWRDRDGNSGKAMKTFEVVKGSEYIFYIGTLDKTFAGYHPMHRFKISKNGALSGFTFTKFNILNWTGKLAEKDKPVGGIDVE